MAFERTKTLLLFLAGSGVAIGIIVAGLIIFQPLLLAGLSSPQTDWDSIHRGDPHLDWALRPDLEAAPLISGQAAYEYTVSTNSHGLRSPALRERTGQFRILAVGDSTTWGYGVENDETWPAQLQRVLEENENDVEVLNAGVAGYTLIQSLGYIRHYGLDLEPDLIILTAGHNDMAIDQPQHEGHFAVRVLKALVDAAVRWARGEGGDFNFRVPPHRFQELLDEFAALCDETGIDWVLVTWPNLREILGTLPHDSYRGLIHDAGQRGGKPVIDAYDMVEDLVAPIFLDNCHFSPLGNRLMADYTARILATHVDTLTGPDGPWEGEAYHVERYLAAGGTDALRARFEEIRPELSPVRDVSRRYEQLLRQHGAW